MDFSASQLLMIFDLGHTHWYQIYELVLIGQIAWGYAVF